jgi:hypothetical protein
MAVPVVPRRAILKYLTGVRFAQPTHHDCHKVDPVMFIGMALCDIDYGQLAPNCFELGGRNASLALIASFVY